MIAQVVRGNAMHGHGFTFICLLLISPRPQVSVAAVTPEYERDWMKLIRREKVMTTPGHGAGSLAYGLAARRVRWLSPQYLPVKGLRELWATSAWVSWMRHDRLTKSVTDRASSPRHVATSHRRDRFDERQDRWRAVRLVRHSAFVCRLSGLTRADRVGRRAQIVWFPFELWPDRNGFCLSSLSEVVRQAGIHWGADSRLCFYAAAIGVVCSWLARATSGLRRGAPVRCR